MVLIDAFKSFISANRLFLPKQRLLLAVSGGLDSAVLCALCYECGFDFEIAHCNFQLRGEESERDEAFVKKLGTKYQVKVWLKRFDTNAYMKANKYSVQEAARELRYTWFNELLNDKETRLDVLLTAHHGDDAVETSLMNYFKGTGISGLRGILPKQGNLLRPLLFAGRKELLDFALNQSLEWVEDSSNKSDKYTRNFFRHQVIPLVEQKFPEAAKNARQNLIRFRETEQLYQQALDMHKKKLLVRKGSEVHIAVLKLQQVVPFQTVLYEIIREYGFSPAQTSEVAALMDSGSGRYVQSSSHRIIRNRAWLIITPAKAETPSLVVIDKPGTYDFPGGKLDLRVTEVPNDHQANNNIALTDASSISFPLILRPWKNGDYFYPLGMQKKKKLARFFIDQKMSATEKENAWVLEMDKKIIWVVGRRIDDRFKVRPSSERVLRISVTS
ncbi:MAG: tRNA lysidine(34) synthetase TilS [Citrobacter freundii]|nr:MAG: tRNA lysidine(34) synthetase TilS [Citrobacter freundii]